MSTISFSEHRVLRGPIRKYRVRRTTEGFFFFSETERKGMAATGLAASAMGLIGVGIGLLGQSTDTYEEADLAEFEIEGEPVQAFLWQSPFEEGDEVEVVAEKAGGMWKAFGITRPADRIIALHPHCSRGRKAHRKQVVKWCLIAWVTISLVAGAMFAIVDALYGGTDWSMFLRELFYVCCLALVIFGAIAWSAGRKYRGFVQMAEIVFRRLGWRDVERIDLPAKSRRLRQPDDPEGLGFTYFRY